MRAVTSYGTVRSNFAHLHNTMAHCIRHAHYWYDFALSFVYITCTAFALPLSSWYEVQTTLHAIVASSHFHEPLHLELPSLDWKNYQPILGSQHIGNISVPSEQH